MPILVLIAAFFSGTLWAKTVRFDFRDPFSRNLIRVDSEANLERTSVLLNTLKGWLEVDPQNLSSGVKGELQIDLRRMETGASTKNDFLKEKLLQTSEFPMATFVVEKWVGSIPKALKEGEPTTLRLAGKTTVRNIGQNIEWSVKAIYNSQSEITKTRMPGNLLRLIAQRDVDLSLFGIAIPDVLKSRFSLKTSVLADLLGSDLSTLDISNLPSY